MTEIRNPRLQGRRLEPTGWRVREAMSPVCSGYGWRWWSLLLCDEGIAAFEWPRGKYWRAQLALGARAGIAHQPSMIVGDSWPLLDGSTEAESPASVLFPYDGLTIEIRRSRWFTSDVRIQERIGERWTFTFADAGKIDRYARQLDRFAPVSRTGWWPKAG